MAKPKTFVAAGDLHGNLQDKDTVKAFLKFTREYNPDVRIFGGDLWDFACLRSGAKDSQDELGQSLDEDYAAGEKFIREYFHGSRGRKIFLMGNHDARPKRLLRAMDARLRDYGARMLEDMQGILKSLGAEVYDYNKRKGVAQVENMRFIHGYSSGLYSTRKAAQAYCTVMHFHTHHIDYFREPSLDNVEAWCPGGLCQLDHDYNSTHMNTLRQQNGWAYGMIFDNGQPPIVNIARKNEQGKGYYVCKKIELVG